MSVRPYRYFCARHADRAHTHTRTHTDTTRRKQPEGGACVGAGAIQRSSSHETKYQTITQAARMSAKTTSYTSSSSLSSSPSEQREDDRCVGVEAEYTRRLLNQRGPPPVALSVLHHLTVLTHTDTYVYTHTHTCHCFHHQRVTSHHYHHTHMGERVGAVPPPAFFIWFSLFAWLRFLSRLSASRRTPPRMSYLTRTCVC